MTKRINNPKSLLIYFRFRYHARASLMRYRLETCRFVSRSINHLFSPFLISNVENFLGLEWGNVSRSEQKAIISTARRHT
jgi:hypothetical protein